MRYAYVSSLWIGLSRAGPADSPERGKNAANNFSCQNKFADRTCDCRLKQLDSAAVQHFAGAASMKNGIFSSEIKQMSPKPIRPETSEGRKGVGPLIPPLTESQRPLRQQVFELVRAAGLIPRVHLA
ncbi:MAG: hypothetical protein KYX65_01990, partial [Tabrizicola sp.]|nr:hypothetical protein [Tabrizicola sp.]